MKACKLWVAVAFCTATALWSSSVYSQTKDEKKPEAAKPTAATQPPGAKPADKPAGDKPAPPAARAQARGSPGGWNAPGHGGHDKGRPTRRVPRQAQAA